jgi:hypothetical protein
MRRLAALMVLTGVCCSGCGYCPPTYKNLLFQKAPDFFDREKEIEGVLPATSSDRQPAASGQPARP